MDFLRRLIGKSSRDASRDRSSRRSSHVSPSRTQPANLPIREDPPADPAERALDIDTPADESRAAYAGEPAFEDAPNHEAAAELDPAPPPEVAAREVDASVKNPSPAPGADRASVQVAQRRPAPQPRAKPRRKTRALSYGIASDAGMARDNNEDACFGMKWSSISVDERPDFGLFALADGMGGHLDGERASGVAVQTLAAEMLDSIGAPMLKYLEASKSPTILEALVKAAEKANRAVVKRVPGGGTTLSAVAIVGNLAYLAHVGDSRAYLIHGDKIEQLTTDHTLVQRLIEMKELTPEEAATYPQKNVLYRALGQNEQLKMEGLIRTMPPGAQVLLCSDGLWDMVEDDAIHEVTVKSGSPQEACDRLVSIANRRGGADNVSVIVIRMPGDEV